jgi:hypothetical protein
MKISKALMLAALGYAGLAAARAAPPTQVGNTFFSTAFQTDPGYVTDERQFEELYYLGADGSCTRLYSRNEALGFVSYDPTLSGTYTYLPAPGNPGEAVLTVSLPDAPLVNSFTLEFSGDTQGSVTGISSIATEVFSILQPADNSFLTNLSNRVALRPADTAITGFVIGGTGSRYVLVRAIGPGLAQFGVAPVSARPALSIFTGATPAASGQPWGAFPGFDAQAMGWIFQLAGAFPLQAGSNDAVYFGLLAPGAYTAQVVDPTSGSAGAAALVEVYILPYSG